MKKEILRLHLVNRVVSGTMGAGKVSVTKADSNARRRQVLAKHADIYAAIADSDPVKAKREMDFHLQELIDHNLRQLTRAESGAFARDLTPEELGYNS